MREREGTQERKRGKKVRWETGAREGESLHISDETKSFCRINEEIMKRIIANIISSTELTDM